MTKTRRQASKEETRRRYLAEAARLFAAHGFHAVSIAAVGEAVGVSGPALYRHFDSKEDMLSQVLLSASQRLVAGLTELLDPEAHPREVIEDLVSFHLDFALSSRDVIRLQDRELASLTPAANKEVRRLQRHYLDAWAEVVRRLRPDLSVPASRVLMHAVFGILNSTAHNEAIAAEDLTREVLRGAALAALGVGSPR